MVAPTLSGSAGSRFRQRKISTKQTLQILKQSQLSDIDNEDLQQRDIQEIETGVDKNEEDEEHLQKILKNSGITSTSNSYIPTPDASKVWDEAAKFYTGKFVEPESYIKSSCQVEDYSGCLYNMDEEDDKFLETFNKSNKKEKLTDDEFESIMFNFEKYITEKQPFLITDPSQILPLDEIKEGLKSVDKLSVENVTKTLSDELKIHPFITMFDPKVSENIRPISELLRLYGNEVYEFYKKRKILRNGKSVHPTLKFNGDDDSDAYACFRQRQFRQQRKTRRADTQSSEKLIKLYQELKATKELTFLVAEREQKRLEAIQVEREIFELRCKVKVMKRELGITDSDEDLVAHKKKKPVPPPPQPQEVKEEPTKKEKKGLSKVGNNVNTQDKSNSKTTTNGPVEDSAGSDQSQQFQPYVKLPPSKIPDLELESVQRLLQNKELSVKRYVEEKLKKRKQTDLGFTNFTDETNNPYFEIFLQNQNVLDASHIPYSSISSSFFDVQSYGYIPDIDKYIEKGTTANENDILLFSNREITKKCQPESYNPLYSENVLTSDSLYTLRKRIGRYGQVFIDRKAMVKKPYNGINEFLNLGEDSDIDQDIESIEEKERFEDRWKYDSDLGLQDIDAELFSDDPSKLNSISNETQVIRFGGMLLSKAYDTLRESVINHRNSLIVQMQRMQVQAQQKQQQLQAQQAAEALAKNDKNSANGSAANSRQSSQQPNSSNPSTQVKYNNQSSHVSPSPKSSSVSQVNNTQVKAES
ncbi:hypothetical protein WICMUC_003680 [Wickerhamomyces mucosus]|uniref:Enhancer of polycomb-like protein n=1 Tax=Wickerhamomyces mucosus TaxID=1378264 RepID=A0A9P8PJS5_9ASCO|nr:hypothetical protein WICMUC_003680 [Wickerhamomyces mucosus]